MKTQIFAFLITTLSFVKSWVSVHLMNPASLFLSVASENPWGKYLCQLPDDGGGVRREAACSGSITNCWWETAAWKWGLSEQICQSVYRDLRGWTGHFSVAADLIYLWWATFGDEILRLFQKISNLFHFSVLEWWNQVKWMENSLRCIYFVIQYRREYNFYFQFNGKKCMLAPHRKAERSWQWLSFACSSSSFIISFVFMFICLVYLQSAWHMDKGK